jgi:hypothetical protein
MLDNAYATSPGCTTTLSRYNRHDVCWLHFKPVPGPIPAPRRKRDDPDF